MLKKDQIILPDENGKDKTYNIVLSFDNDDYGKTYIVYTDMATDEDDVVQLYAAKYDIGEDIPKFEKVESDEEWAIINYVIKKSQKEVLYS